MRLISIAILLSLIFGAQVSADTLAFEGNRTISLVEANGTHYGVAEIQFQNGTTTIENEDRQPEYKIIWDEAQFDDHFLSMRPFKCLEGSIKQWCRVPYPYEIRRILSDGELTDLEYDLIFVWRKTTDYGVDLWNGVIYELVQDGNSIIGVMQEFDLNILAAPPEAGNFRPIRQVDRHLADPDSHWLPTLVIE